jgi:hypothetical protein
MTVDQRTSLSIVNLELDACKEDAALYNWEISPIDEQNQTFTVKMKSPRDQQEYIIEVKFDNYKEAPLYIEFIDPITKQRGIRNAYPFKQGDNFFNTTGPCICHPCSRKCYGEHAGLHRDWTQAGWQRNAQVSSLTNIDAILLAIYSRISSENKYDGRMHA